MLKYYAKLFFLSGLFFFLGALYTDMNVMEGKNSVTEAIVLGTLMGIVISGCLGTLHIIRARRIAGGKRAWDIYSVKQRSELHLPLEPDRSFSLLQQYFAEVAHFNMTGADKIAGTISGRTPMVYFRTFGNSVSAEVKADTAGGSLVSITSKPLLPATLTDFGDNLKIVMAIEKYLLASSHLQ